MIDFLDHLGDLAIHFAWPMFWQSSLLIAVLFALDFALRRKVRTSVRYALWLVVLVKLVLPPTLALPTGLAWWLRPSAVQPLPQEPRQFVVSYSDEPMPTASYVPVAIAPVRAPEPHLSLPAFALVVSGGVSLALLVYLVWRWSQVARQIRKSTESSEALNKLFLGLAREVGVRSRVRLRLTGASMSPAVCGLVRPCIVLPKVLVETFEERANEKRSPSPLPSPPGEGASRSKLRAVLLHELMHVRRADVWVNCAQTVLQIVYWWHPLLWLANVRIRRLREEAVDDAVMMALREDADVYAPTLLEVAKLAFHRPLASLGLVGILESKRALTRRIERLMDFQPPRRAGLSFISVLAVAAFTCMAVPQGEAPSKIERALLQTSPTSYAGKVHEDQWTYLGEYDGWERLRFPGKTEDEPWPAFMVRPRNDLGLLHSKQAGNKRLESIWSGRTSFDTLPLCDVVKILNEDAQKNEPAPEHIKFVLSTLDPDHPVNPMLGSPLRGERDIGAVNIIVIPALRDVRLKELLDSIVKAGNQPDGSEICYTAFESSVVFSWKPRNGTETQARTYAFDPAKFIRRYRPVAEKAPGSEERGSGARISTDRVKATDRDEMAAALRAFFHSRGVDLSLPKAVFWNESERTLLVRAVKGDFDLIETGLATIYGAVPTSVEEPSSSKYGDRARLIKSLQEQGITYEKFRERVVAEFVALNEAKQADGNNTVPPSDATGEPPPVATSTNLIRKRGDNQARVRRMILGRLTGTRVARVNFENVSLSELIPVLREQSRGGDPEKSGMNFILAPDSTIDFGAVKIKMSDTLTNITLLEVLNAIVAHAEKPIKFTIEDYGVVFSPKTGNGPQLMIRTFRLNPTNFLRGLERATSATSGSLVSSNLTPVLRSYLHPYGVNLEPPKNLFWTDTKGTLLVRATMDDLDKIEAELAFLNTAPRQSETNAPQINIRVKLVAIPKKSSAAFWKGLAATNSPSGPDGIILSSTQAVAILKSLKSQKGFEVLSEPQVTTLSGHQARIQVGQVQPILMWVTNGDNEPHYNMTNFFSGQEVDLIAHVEPNSGAIQLTATNTLTEFLGYDDPGKRFVEVLVGGKPTRVKPPLPHFRVQNLATNVTVLDGQTLVLGRPQITGTVNNKAAKPVVRKEAERKDVVVFIMPTLIDAEGNPVGVRR